MTNDKPLRFSVHFWGSDPAEENDDCWTGDDFATMAEAMAIVADPSLYFKTWRVYDAQDTIQSTMYFEVCEDGATVQLVKNPRFNHKRRDNADYGSSERAMQAGMMGGCDAYNDEMGY